MPHDDVERDDGVGRNLSFPVECFVQSAETHLSDELYGHSKYPVTSFTRQRHFELNLKFHDKLNGYNNIYSMQNKIWIDNNWWSLEPIKPVI